jgi:hypothetical protein
MLSCQTAEASRVASRLAHEPRQAVARALRRSRCSAGDTAESDAAFPSLSMLPPKPGAPQRASAPYASYGAARILERPSGDATSNPATA